MAGGEWWSAAAEGALVSATAALLALQLIALDWCAEACTIVVLCFGLSLLGFLRPAVLVQKKVNAARQRCCFRPDATEGLALGCCMPVLLLGALSAARLSASASTGPLRLHLWAAIGCAIQPALALLHHGSPLPAGAGALALGLATGLLPTLAALGAPHALLFVLGTLTLHAAACEWALAHVMGSFTLGEAAALAQSVAILATDASLVSMCHAGVVQRHDVCAPRSSDAIATEALLAGGLVLVAALGVLLAAASSQPPPTRTGLFVAAMASALGGVLLPWFRWLVGASAPSWIIQALTQPGRPRLVLYWALSILLACAVAYSLAPPLPPSSSSAAAANDDVDDDGRPGSGSLSAPASHNRRQRPRARLLLVRKLYHFLALALFVPGVLHHLAFVQLAFACVLPAFLVLELIRACHLPPLAEPLGRFLAPFIDSRDGGTLILTHVYLLLGCATPVWLAAAVPSLPTPTAPPPDDHGSRGLLSSAALAAAPYAGLVVLGVGDSVASLVGVHFGRTRWPHSRKTIEGSAAAVGAMLLLLALVLRWTSAIAWGLVPWAALASACALACMLEATTSQIDNLFLPLYFQTLLLIAAAPAAPGRPA
jgi:dolichol kinase